MGSGSLYNLFIQYRIKGDSMSEIGYIRVSSVGQNDARQLDGVLLDKTFKEKISGKSIHRPDLDKCADGSLYCGITNDLENRLEKHSQGTASKYTASRLPVELVASKDGLTKSEALKLELKIKKLPAKEKVLKLNQGQ